MKPAQIFQVINICVILMALLFGYQNCAGRVEGQSYSKMLDTQSIESWELLVTSESGDIVFENQSVHLNVNAAKPLEGAICQWSHERKGQTTSFETKDCSLNLEAVTVDDEGLYSTRVVLPDGDSILLGPILLQVAAGDGNFPAISNVLPEYDLENKEVASILATLNDDVGSQDCAVEWKNLDRNAKVACGNILNFDGVTDSNFGEYEVRFVRGNKMHVQYFTVQNKATRGPASKPLSCGHSIGRVSDLVSDLRASIPEGYVGEFGDFRWSLPQLNRETADRLCSLADSNFVAADNLKAQLVEFKDSGLPVMNVRRFDPPTRKWASVCSNTDFDAGTCKSEWIIQSLTCCKSP